MPPLESCCLLIHRYFLLNLQYFVLIFIIFLSNESIFQFGLSSVDGGIHIGGWVSKKLPKCLHLLTAKGPRHRFIKSLPCMSSSLCIWNFIPTSGEGYRLCTMYTPRCLLILSVLKYTYSRYNSPSLTAFSSSVLVLVYKVHNEVSVLGKNGANHLCGRLVWLRFFSRRNSGMGPPFINNIVSCIRKIVFWSILLLLNLSRMSNLYVPMKGGQSNFFPRLYF